MTTYRLAKHGQFFATRHAARNVRGRIETEALNDGERIVIDLDGVEAVSGAFADELVGELWTRHGTRLLVVGGNPDVSETVALVLTRRGAPT